MIASGSQNNQYLTRRRETNAMRLTKRCLIIFLGTMLISAIAIPFSGCSNNRLAAEGDTVLVHYTGTLEDGTVFDSSLGGDPLEFTLGAGSVIPGFENAVYGMKKGQSKTFTIPAEEAYGPRDEALIMVIDRDKLPAGLNLSIGSQMTVTLTNGNQTTAIITEITETTVTLDANFFLAGKDLTFEITLVDIR